MNYLLFEFLGQQLLLLPQKAIYWREERALLLSDLHLGKVSHFRKVGIAVPGAAALGNFQILDMLLRAFEVRKLIILGDLFHSELNLEWALFVDWLGQYPDLNCVLVKGNHDILPEVLYQNRNMVVYPETLIQYPFVFSHIPLLTPSTSGYNLSGHIHPGVKLSGKGGQQLRLPCFYFGRHQGLLPAFGAFTGKAVIRPEKESHVFVVTPERVFPV
jgi:DNA ligase-associated metallophosphoesterase